MIPSKDILPHHKEVKSEVPIVTRKPLVLIKASTGWVSLNLGDLLNYRDLLYILATRDIKVRYKQTVLGALWAIIQPLFTMIIFSLIFGKVANMPSDNIPYPLFAYAGLLPWTFFSTAVTSSGNSLVGNSNLITKVYFPRMIIPMASVTSGLLDFLIAFGMLLVLMAYYRVGFSVNILILPFLLILTCLSSIGIGMWMSALNVKYRDIRYALPFLIQIGMFAAPIVYPLSAVPEKWRWLLALNPITGQIEAYRSAFFGMPFNWTILVISTVVTTLILIYSTYNFRRMEREFADLI